MTPIVPETWPPIIDDVALPRILVWRDRLFTLAMWLLLLFLCRHALAGFATALNGLLSNGHLTLTGWHARWTRLHPYLVVVAILAAWELVWLLITLWRRRQALRQPPPQPLSPAEEAGKSRITVDMLARWRLLKVCTVHFDAESNPSVQGGD